MSEASAPEMMSVDAGRRSGGQFASAALRWLRLAAAPTFSGMAIWCALPGAEAAMTCGQASPMTGMTAMYALMALFHLAPWLKLFTPADVGESSRQTNFG